MYVCMYVCMYACMYVCMCMHVFLLLSHTTSSNVMNPLHKGIHIGLGTDID